jgi:hypothetical protein
MKRIMVRGSWTLWTVYMSTMAKNDPIPVDDQSGFFCQIVDSSLALLHTARPGGYLDFFNQHAQE